MKGRGNREWRKEIIRPAATYQESSKCLGHNLEDYCRGQGKEVAGTCKKAARTEFATRLGELER
jgi:hypothetical protein